MSTTSLPPVLIIHNAYLYKGGEETVVANEIESLQKNGFKVYYKEFTNEHFGGFTFKTILAPFNTIFNFFSFFRILFFIKKHRIKVVHTHNFFYTASPSIFWAAKIAGAKTVLTIHNYRLFCLSANFFRAGQNCTQCNDNNSFKKGIQLKCFKNSSLASWTLAASIRLNERIGTWKHKVDHYIVLNEFTRQLFINKGIHPEKITLKANFLSNVPAENTLKNPEPFYLFAGRLTEEKGIQHLIKAFTNSDKKLIIAGNGDLADWVSQLNEPNIKYIGLQNKEQIQGWMQRCKALIFPSIWIESMPMTIIEAQSMGVIPIVAASINTNNMIQDGVDGLLYEANNPDSLLGALNRFEAIPPHELLTIAQNARNKSLNVYGEWTHIEKIKEIYST